MQRTFFRNNEWRFAYAICKTLDRAESVLEDMFATGDVFPSEGPKIEKVGKFYCVTLRA